MTGKSETGATSEQYLEMSDEDFLNMNSPAGDDAPAEAGDAPTQTADQTADEAASAEAAAAVNTDPDAGASTDDQPSSAAEPVAGDDAAAVGDPSGSGDQPGSKPEAKDPASEAKAAAEAGDKPAAAGEKPGEPGDKSGDKGTKPEPVKDEAKPVDYEAFFKQVMTPFKANGRTIELRSPEEAIRLMQMGAGYGRKIQDLQPHLKVLRMLEKNDLMDEERLSFLIDVNQKNPDAIKKIIKDSGIDPLDLNINDNVDYAPKSHAVSDQEMAFNEALDDVKSYPSGNETLRTINQTWDQVSKQALGDNPKILKVIQEQRDSGIYDQIVAEIDRQKILGTIPHSTPFLQAYTIAGDHLQATNGFKVKANPTQPEVTPQPQVIATRTAAPKAQVQNGDKAAAAASPKTIPANKAATTVNPLEMADDDFLKTFQGRI
ncbi:hypothetical protein [Brucella anthropi]|uniref:hypothetical protein n=1 Tax=Brucella anthropi TaxID=529 RepID=UPI000F68D14F|nr:hypothetical protein [Brucella anthropi]RRY03823.1 hypothetical protein EGJ58_22235 [Brucella anthropi]